MNATKRIFKRPNPKTWKIENSFFSWHPILDLLITLKCTFIPTFMLSSQFEASTSILSHIPASISNGRLWFLKSFNPPIRWPRRSEGFVVAVLELVTTSIFRDKMLLKSDQIGTKFFSVLSRRRNYFGIRWYQKYDFFSLWNNFMLNDRLAKF